MDFEMLIDVTLSGLGYEMVDVERSGKNGLLRVFVDKPGGINVDDCAYVSQHLSRVLAVEGVEYGRLEISSPGLNRVLRRERDFARFVGCRLKIKVRNPIDGQRNFVGELRSVRDGKLEFDMDGKKLVFEVGGLDKARLVPNI